MFVTEIDKIMFPVSWIGGEDRAANKEDYYWENQCSIRKEIQVSLIR